MGGQLLCVGPGTGSLPSPLGSFALGSDEFHLRNCILPLATSDRYPPLCFVADLFSLLKVRPYFLHFRCQGSDQILLGRILPFRQSNLAPSTLNRRPQLLGTLRLHARPLPAPNLLGLGRHHLPFRIPPSPIRLLQPRSLAPHCLLTRCFC